MPAVALLGERAGWVRALGWLRRNEEMTLLKNGAQVEGIMGEKGAPQGDNGFIIIVEGQNGDAQTRTTCLLTLVVLATVGGRTSSAYCTFPCG